MSKLPKLTKEEIAALSHEQLGDAVQARGLEVPARKVDRIAALEAYEPEADDATKNPPEPGEETEEAKAARLEQEAKDRAAQEENLRRSNLTQAQRDAEDAADGKKPGKQDGTGKRAGAASTAPEKPVSTIRPYLDSPQPFGIHIEGILMRFPKGRFPIRDTDTLTQAQILKALKTDGYVADNGAEVVE